MGKKKKVIKQGLKNKESIKQNIKKNIYEDILNINMDVELKEILREREINSKVIPSGGSLKEVLTHLKEKNWNIAKLKKYEKGCYSAYKLNNVLEMLKDFEEKYWPEILKINVLSIYGNDIGPNCAAMYLVGYVAENMGAGEAVMKEYCKIAGITEKEIFAKSIYYTGKSDGQYLGVLNEDGTVADWDFFEKWVMG